MAFTWIDGGLIVLAIYILLKYWLKGKTDRLKSQGINFINPILLLGNTSQSVFGKKHMANCIKEVCDAFPEDKFVAFFEFAQPVIILKDVDLIREVAVKNFDHAPDHRMVLDEENDVLFGKSLFSLKGDKWKQMRSTMAPAFTPSRLKKMSVLLAKAAEQMKQHFQDRIKKEGVQILKIDGKEVFTAYFNDLMAMAGFGLDINSFEDKDTTFLKESIKMTDLHFWRLLKFLCFSAFPNLMKKLGLAFIEKETVTYFRKIVVGTINHREQENIQRPDFLELMIKVKKGQLEYDDTSTKTNSFVISEDKFDDSKIAKKRVWTDDDLTAQATIFMIAGLDTGSSSLAFVFFELAKNPDIQKRLQKEIDEALKEHETFNYDAIQSMDYLNMVVSESLRKYAGGAPTSDRICVKDINIGPPRPGAKDHIVKKGEGLAISLVSVQRNPKYWPNPMKFDPERFSKENRHKIVPYSFMPFGIGPRICIGYRFGELAMKLAVAYMLTTFDIVPTDETPDVLEYTPMSLTLKAANYNYGLQLRR